MIQFLEVNQPEGAQKIQAGQEVSISYKLFRQVDPDNIVAKSESEPYKFILGAN